MKTRIVGMLLAAIVLTGSAGAKEVARELPYAAGNPNGGLPLWNPGDKFVAVSGGSCSGSSFAAQHRARHARPAPGAVALAPLSRTVPRRALEPPT